MEDKICGQCSQEEGLPIEERVAIAMTRLPNVVYFCPVCKAEHQWVWKFGSIKREVKEEVKAEPVAKKKKSSARDEMEQLVLF